LCGAKLPVQLRSARHTRGERAPQARSYPGVLAKLYTKMAGSGMACLAGWPTVGTARRARTAVQLLSELQPRSPRSCTAGGEDAAGYGCCPNCSVCGFRWLHTRALGPRLAGRAKRTRTVSHWAVN